ncbi:hypothetical protein [Paracoccus sp. S1E-3]|uniref:hypothetical protein n=1 Tax=Paracoccus sp. S1E-3 TaxID=2756130 RepID=UPI0015EFAFD9|nr:hypothetical protein [Paracoccus sp. S1E-3]MBA4489374.1 hypothetical protein [Paracoccus sp. S1E-3]
MSSSSALMPSDRGRPRPDHASAERVAPANTRPAGLVKNWLAGQARNKLSDISPVLMAEDFMLAPTGWLLTGRQGVISPISVTARSDRRSSDGASLAACICAGFDDVLSVSGDV